jgi:hypothetical protein
VCWKELQGICVAAAADLAELVADWDTPEGYDQPRYGEHRHKCQEQLSRHLESLRRVERPAATREVEFERFLRFASKIEAALDWDPRGPRFCRLRLAELEAVATELRALGGDSHG